MEEILLYIIEDVMRTEMSEKDFCGTLNCDGGKTYNNGIDVLIDKVRDRIREWSKPYVHQSNEGDVILEYHPFGGVVE